jgi:S1-C subfamily serine protease
MKYILLLFSFFILKTSESQSLSPERIAKIKAATVRITIDSANDIGTGFFVNENGWLLTCWHVIKPALIKNPFSKIFAELNTGEKLQFGIPDVFLNDTTFIKECIVYDFCFLVPVKQSSKKFQFLSVGRYSDLKEGEQVYTCGYPLGIKQQFISQGMVSTKYADTISYYKNGILLDKSLRNQSLIDLTLNTGNSGGAVVKLGATPNEDQIIGIADFIIIPYGQAVEALNDYSKKQGGDVEIMGISTMKAY